MYNWSVDLKKLKTHKTAYAIWRLEQMINFGLNNEKLNAALVKKYWRRLRLDPQRRKFLKFILWGNKSWLLINRAWRSFFLNQAKALKKSIL